MSRNPTLITLAATAIGFGVPAVTLYLTVYYGLNLWVAGILSGIAIIMGTVVAIVGVAIGPLGHSYDDLSASDSQRLGQMRAHQKATLEEMDEIIVVLEEIRDTLKVVEE